MYNDLLASLQRRIGNDDTEGAVREYQYAVNFINEHWTDPFGKSVYAKYQLLEIELQNLEKRRSRLILQMEEIKEKLQNIINDQEDDAHKPRTRVYTHPTDGNYNSSGGPVRRKC